MPSEPRVFSLTNRRTRKATVSTIKPKRVHDLNFRDSFKGFDDGDAYSLEQSLFVRDSPQSASSRSFWFREAMDLACSGASG